MAQVEVPRLASAVRPRRADHVVHRGAGEIRAQPDLGAAVVAAVRLRDDPLRSAEVRCPRTRSRSRWTPAGPPRARRRAGPASHRSRRRQAHVPSVAKRDRGGERPRSRRGRLAEPPPATRRTSASMTQCAARGGCRCAPVPSLSGRGRCLRRHRDHRDGADHDLAVPKSLIVRAPFVGCRARSTRAAPRGQPELSKFWMPPHLAWAGRPVVVGDRFSLARDCCHGHVHLTDA